MTAHVSESSPTALRLFGAVLLYRDAQRVLARQHPVVIEKGNAPRLGAGSLVTGTMVDELLELSDRCALTYVPSNVVAVSRNAIAWFEPAYARTMYFKPSSDAAVAAFDGKSVPQPPLLLIAQNRSLDVFALAENVRPTLQTPLYRAPYWNVFEGRGNNDGRVCLGSMALPDSVEPQGIGAWTEAFFASNFTHLTGGKRWLRAGTYAELLTAAVAANRFDPAWLIGANVTVEGAICSN
jgi:PRTRC genetic system protein B